MKPPSRRRHGARWLATIAILSLAPALASAGPAPGIFRPIIASAAAPQLVVETPAANATVSGTVQVVGWAADPSATSGTGVDEVSIWLDGGPQSGGALLGQATYGLPRPDVAAALGSEQFNRSGYSFAWDTSALSSTLGAHTLIVAARAGPEWTEMPVALTVAPPPATPPAAAKPLTVQIVSVTSPAARNSQATLVAQTLPGARCNLAVYGSRGLSSGQGIDARTADENGRVSWTWKVLVDTFPGVLEVQSLGVQCTLGGQTAGAQTTMMVR